jgi:hypothetical protein
MNTKNPGQGYTPFETKGPLPETKGVGSQAGAATQAKAQEAGTKAKQTAAEVTEQIKQKGAEALHQARDKADEVTGRQKEYLIERLNHCGAASRKAAEQLRNDKDSTLAHYADVIARQLDRGAEYVRDHNLRGVYRDAENLAKRQPEMFFGGMFLAGLGLARFLKASSEHSHAADTDFEEASRAMTADHTDDVEPVEVSAPVYGETEKYPPATSGTPPYIQPDKPA